MPGRRSSPFVPAPGSQLARWGEAIAGLVEIGFDWAPAHERPKPTFTLCDTQCWKIQLPGGRIGWARTRQLERHRPDFYVPPDIAEECLLRHATSLGRGIEWARSQIGRDTGLINNSMRDAILKASP